MNKETVFEKIEHFRAVADDVASEQHEEAELDLKFYNGKEEALTLGVYSEDQRAIVNFNHIKPVIDAVSGLFRQLRRETIYIPREGEEEMREALSAAMNKAKDVLSDDANLCYLESQQDALMLITGLGAIDTGVTFLHNAHGSVRGKVIQPTQIYIDPGATQPNLMDAEFVRYIEPMSLGVAVKKFPNADEADFLPVDGEMGGSGNRIKDRSQPDYGKQTWDKFNANKQVGVEKLEWREIETVRIYRNPAYASSDNPLFVEYIMQELNNFKATIQEIIDEDDSYEDGFRADFDPTNQTLVVPEKWGGALETLLAEFGELEYDTRERYCYYTAFSGSSRTFKFFKSIDQQGFTIKVKTGYYDHDSGTWYGMVRQMREPSLYLNKTMTEMLYILASRAKGGVMYEESAVTDPVEFEELWAQTDAAIEVADGALAGGKIQPKQEPATATGYENLLATFFDLPTRQVGLNPQFLGQANDPQVSGVLEQQRIKQVQSVLAAYIDSISMYQTDMARLFLSYIRYLVKVNDNFAVSLVGKDGRSAMVDLTDDVVDLDYMVEIGEAPAGPAMQEARAKAMMAFADKIATMTGNVAIYGVAAEQMDAYGVSQQDIQKMMKIIQPEPTPEAMQQQQQQQQIKQQMAQMEMENKQADTAKKMADAEKSKAQAMEIQQETGQQVAMKQMDVGAKMAELEVKSGETQLKRNELVMKAGGLL